MSHGRPDSVVAVLGEVVAPGSLDGGALGSPGPMSKLMPHAPTSMIMSPPGSGEPTASLLLMTEHLSSARADRSSSSRTPRHAAARKRGSASSSEWELARAAPIVEKV